MSFTSYITYEEYQGLGGKVTEDAFPNLERRAQRVLDYITFDRVKKLTTIPDEVKEVITEFINMYHDNESVANMGGIYDSYSNGVEKIEVSDNAQESFSKKLYSLAISWLPSYLTARSIGYDFERYLQQTNNNP